jgi:formyltetrahydrofolate synthetase
MAMLQISEQNLKDLENKTGRTLVGEILRQIEVVEAQQLSKEESLSLLKPLIKNKVYETLRQHTALINQFSNGISFSIDFINPKA